MPPFYILLGILLLLCSLQTHPCSSETTGSDNLMVGQAFSVGDRLVSRNGKFALGFFEPASTISKSHNSTSLSSNWYLGIWFNKIPVCTVVWVANRDVPIIGPKLNQTQLKISKDGNLVIVHNTGVIWSTRIVTNRTGSSINNTSSIVLMNIGNLALKQSPSSDLLLWQSFDYPTDVVLPGAKFGRNKITGLNHKGISKKSMIDPGLGSYSVELDSNGDGVVLQRRKPSVMYRYYAFNSSSFVLLPRIIKMLEMDPRTKSLIPRYVNNNEEEYYMYTSPNESYSTFLLLDISGQIKLNFWSEAKKSWEAILTDPLDICTPAATCGPFSVCNGNAKPSCDCMEHFSKKSPLNWQFGDRTEGCIRNTLLYCTTDNKNTTSSTDMFQPIARVTLPYDPQSVDIATTQRMCEEACLSSCSCTAYSYNNSICSVWHDKLLGVNLNDGLEINSEDTLYLRLSAKDLPSLQNNKRKANVKVVTVAGICSFGLLVLMLLLAIWRNKLWCRGVLLHDNQSPSGIIAFKYTDLVQATKNFSEKLGGGGFGSVYKGVLSDSTTIAVKRLDGARQGEKQFRAEVSSIGLIQHVNLVKLIGFCCQGDNRLLVYEHMVNGSLDGRLFKSNGVVLNWDTRYQIVLGIARGLSYLHHSCRECIIHCDIKPENILLDASFAPKVADFGMASIVGRNFSRVLTTFRGTVGYLAPEWLSGVAITSKIDVYSFGMVLLEIISGMRNLSEAGADSGDHVQYFPVRAINKLHERDTQSLVDPELHGDFNVEQAELVCKVASRCIQDNEFDRPTMSEIVLVLEGLQDIDMPPMPRLLAALAERQTSM